MPKKIILDCDPGHDDAIAILLAHGSPEIELLAITTVAGNQSLPKVTRNALAVATVAGITDVPIAAGADGPLIRTARFAGEIHGESGMDGPRLPDPTVSLDPRRAAALIVELVMAHEPGEITLVPTGPLTNIALAARLEPAIVSRVREVVLMGGGATTGNMTATAEFNIHFDPEAASVVFDLPWTVTMVGLDVTHEAKATPDVRAKVGALGTPSAVFVNELLDFFASTYLSIQGFDAPPVHDPCAVALVIDPTIFEVRRAPISVETAGTHTLGMTVVDLRPYAPIEGLTNKVALSIDSPRFWDLVVDALERIG
jgi:purine nucleosidase